MKIVIKETKKIEMLSIIDPKSGVDYIYDFIGNTGDLENGQFEFSDDLDAYACDQDAFKWWHAVISDNQKLNDRIYELEQHHGSDAVYDAIQDAGSVDLENHAANVNQALDEAFGATK